MPRDIEAFLEGRDRSRSPKAGTAKEVSEKVEQELHHYKSRMSLLERCRWSLRGNDRIQGLIKILRRHNEDLFRLCSWEALSQINRGLPTLTLPQSKNFMDLHLIADISEEAAKDANSPVAEGRQRVADMARFKARMMTPSNLSSRYHARWQLLNYNDYKVQSKDHDYSLGINRRSNEPVFVEWQSYKGRDNRPDRFAEEQINELADFLSIPSRPKEFRTLDCAGLFKDKANDRYRVVFELPKHLRKVSDDDHSGSRRIYNPSTLTDFIHNVDGIIDLGIRFNLARKLVYSVVVLHTCGWLHKNLRPENILFFPAPPAADGKLKGHRKDVGHPVIVGYGLSRPDDVSVAYRSNVDPGAHNVSRTDRFARESPLDRVSRRTPKAMQDLDRQDQLNRKIYQHPDKVARPDRRYRHSYDVYSLGLLLLEIGLWQSLQQFEASRSSDTAEFHQFVLGRLVPDLWGQCGSIYGSVVKDCLTMSTDDAILGAESQRRLAWDIAERLDKCVA